MRLAHALVGLAAVALSVSSCAARERPRQAANRACSGEQCGPPFPRLANYRIEHTFDAEAERMLERVGLAIVEVEANALRPDVLPRIRAKNPHLTLLAYLTSEEIPRDPNPEEQPLALARFPNIAPAHWLTEPGSRTREDIGADATTIAVEDASAFRVARPPSDFYPEEEPTYLLLGDEHVRLVGVAGDRLEVERGYRSAAKPHPRGTRIAAHVVFFSGTWMMNLGAKAPRDETRGTWRDMLAAEAIEYVRKGPYTGIFLDVCFSDISFLNGGLLDVDADGVADDVREASRQWSEGFGMLVRALREQLGPSVPLVGNPGAQDCPHDALDGILLEGWPLGMPPAYLAFDVGFARYLAWTRRPGHRPLSVANAFSPKIGFGQIAAGQDEVARADYAAMRFGLTMALQGDGYAAYDNGVFGHYVSWWYDEYDGAGRGDGYLGHPVGETRRDESGAFVRAFERGLAIANPTQDPVDVRVPAGYRKLKGTQDPLHNDGAEVHGTLRVAAKDGYVLVRP